MGVGPHFVFLMHTLLALPAGRLHVVGTTDTALPLSCKSHQNHVHKHEVSAKNGQVLQIYGETGPIIWSFCLFFQQLWCSYYLNDIFLSLVPRLSP